MGQVEWGVGWGGVGWGGGGWGGGGCLCGMQTCYEAMLIKYQ